MSSDEPTKKTTSLSCDSRSCAALTARNGFENDNLPQQAHDLVSQKDTMPPRRRTRLVSQTATQYKVWILLALFLTLECLLLWTAVRITKRKKESNRAPEKSDLAVEVYELLLPPYDDQPVEPRFTSWDQVDFRHWECLTYSPMSVVDDDYQIMESLGTRLSQKYYCMDSIFQFGYTFIGDPWQQALRDYVRNRNPAMALDEYFRLRTKNGLARGLSKFPGAYPADILDTFHFVGIAERLEESLVVLKRLLNLTWYDIAYFNTTDPHANIGFDKRQRKCYVQRHPLPKEARQRVKELSSATPLSSDSFLTWKKENERDWGLWQMANAQLDATMNVLGRESVLKDAAILQALVATFHDQCQKHVRFACLASGHTKAMEGTQSNHSCYVSSNVGCADLCLPSISFEPMVTTDLVERGHTLEILKQLEVKREAAMQQEMVLAAKARARAHMQSMFHAQELNKQPKGKNK